MHRNSILAFKKFCSKHFKEKSVALEIGPDTFPSSFQSMKEISYKKWDTMDIYSSDKLTYQNKDEFIFPINDAVYDIVLAANVLEHVRKPWIWIKEVARVCKKGG